MGSGETPRSEPATTAEELVEPVTEAPTEEELPASMPVPSVVCRDARSPDEEDSNCPWFDLCFLKDADAELRASFHAQMAWWHPISEDRLVIALRTCRDPDTGRERWISPGDAPQEVLEVVIPEQGDPSWRLLGRAQRGDLACVLSDDGRQAACLAVHVQRSMVWAWILDLGGDRVTVTHVTVERTPGDLVARTEVRFHEGRFEALIGAGDSDEADWAPLVPAADTGQ